MNKKTIPYILLSVLATVFLSSCTIDSDNAIEECEEIILKINENQAEITDYQRSILKLDPREFGDREQLGRIQKKIAKLSNKNYDLLWDFMDIQYELIHDHYKNKEEWYKITEKMIEVMEKVDYDCIVWKRGMPSELSVLDILELYYREN
jgi:hypothetical protein